MIMLLEIVLMLLERRGEIVRRNEIVARVWGNDVFLDTDNSIRGAPDGGIASSRRLFLRLKNTRPSHRNLNHQSFPNFLRLRLRLCVRNDN